MKRLKLLEIIPTVPYPIRAGGTMALFTMLDGLRKFLDITVIFIIKQDRNNAISELQSLWPDIEFHTLTSKKSFAYYFQKLGEKLYGMGVFNDPGTTGFVNPFSRYSPKLIEDLSYMIKQISPDIIQTEFYPNQDLVYSFPSDTKKVFVQHEIHYVVNEMWLKAHRSWNKSYARAAFNMLKGGEIAAMNAYDAVFTLNEADKKRLTADGVTTPIFSSPVGVLPVSYRNPCHYDNRLVFIGAGGHPPNVEGLEWFLYNVWDSILSKHPDTILNIIGNWPRSQTEKYKNIPKINFLGIVKDLGEALNGAISIVPILSGSGIRMKILDAVNYGTPFISTTVGALDMGFEDGRDCYIADSVNDFSKKLSKLITNSSIREKFYENSFKVYNDNYSVNQLIKKRLEYYNNIFFVE